MPGDPETDRLIEALRQGVADLRADAEMLADVFAKIDAASRAASSPLRCKLYHEADLVETRLLEAQAAYNRARIYLRGVMAARAAKS
jgi:hypothetical protein